MLRWDRKSQMWLPGEQLATSLWAPSSAAYQAARAANAHQGPYVPMMLEACAEDQLACEYRPL